MRSRTLLWLAGLAMVAAACGAPSDGSAPAPEPEGTIRAGCQSPCLNETPTEPLPKSSYPSVDGMDVVTDVGHITAVEYDGDHPVLVWDRIAFHFCTPEELDEQLRRQEIGQTSGCLNGYASTNDNPTLRRYRVAIDAVLLVPDRTSNDWTLHRAGIEALPELTGPRGPIVVSANLAGEVTMIGEAFVP